MIELSWASLVALVAFGVVLGGGTVSIVCMSTTNHPDRPLPPLK